MTRETKVGLLVGMGVILLVGIILSDLLSAHRQSPDLTNYAQSAQNTISGSGNGVEPTLVRDNDYSPVSPLNNSGVVVGTPGELVLGGSNTVPGRGGSAVSVPPLQSREQVPAPTAPPVYYFVQAGDTFAQIALKNYGDPSLGSIIRDANPTAVNPDGTLRVTAKIVIPPKPQTTISPATPLPYMGGGPMQPVTPMTPLAPAPTAKTIKVESGDTLGALAKKYLGASNRWPELLKANKDQIDRPQDLRIGMVLKLPADAAPHTSTSTSTSVVTRTGSAPVMPSAASGSTYVVASGDTLYRIAASKMGNGNLWKQLYNANRATITDPANLDVGMKLTIPKH